MRSLRRRVRVSRRSGVDKGLAIFLDSTYPLPVFGVGVRGVDEEALLRLRGLALRHAAAKAEGGVLR